MAAVAAVGVGMMMMCCSSSVAAVMMSGEEKKDDSGGGGGGGADDDSDSDDDTTLTATEQAKADAATAKAAADAVAADPDATLNEKRLATNTSALAAQAAADAVATDPDATPADTVAADTEAENAKAVAAKAAADKAVADAMKSLGKFCFSGYTKVKMASGENMCIKDISLGDELAGGTLVDATMQIKNRSNDPFYRFNSTELGDCVYVTGSHYIHHDDKYIFVRDHPEAVLTDKCDDILYCLVTSDHTIPVGEFKFWDWEDNLISN